MDYLILLLMEKLMKKQSKRMRKFLSAITGGIGACLVVVIPFFRGIPVMMVFSVILAVLMIRISFHYNGWRELIKDTVIFFAITFLIGGILNSLYYYTSAGYYMNLFIKNVPYHAVRMLYVFIIFALACAFIYLVKIVLQQIRNDKELFQEVEFVFEGKKLQRMGIVDSGNQLREPISKKPVAVAEYDAIKELLPLELKSYAENFLSSEEHKDIDRYALRIKWIPYHAVGTEEGILLSVLFDEVNIMKDTGIIQNKQVAVALYHGRITQDDSYHVIIHKELL
jgi:stage II sporulation protein GA (sporulation sigma-E factor processing peptidase)